MSTTIAPITDPTGLGGERVFRDEAHAPDVLETWLYRGDHDFGAIELAWKAASRARKHAIVMSVTPHKQSGSNRYVNVRLFEWPAPAPLHIDEPNEV